MPQSLGSEKIKDILKIGVGAFRYLKQSGQLLPLERTDPAYNIVGFFHPAYPLISYLQDVGFHILSQDGGGYDEPCKVGYFKL